MGLPQVKVEEVVATMLDQAINGIEKETLLNDDLARIGQKMLSHHYCEKRYIGIQPCFVVEWINRKHI